MPIWLIVVIVVVALLLIIGAATGKLDGDTAIDIIENVIEVFFD